MARLLLLIAALALAAVVLFRPKPGPPAVSTDPANPYRWADLAEAKLEQGRAQEAEVLMERAVWLAPNIPPIRMRATNLYLRVNKPDQVLRHSLPALHLVPDYDGVIFSYYDQLGRFPIEQMNQRALHAFLRYKLTRRQVREVAAIWDLLVTRTLFTKELAAEVASFYAARQQYRQADSVWRQANCADSRPDCPGFIFNGGFEAVPLAGPFDWTLPASATIDGSGPRFGRRSLHFQFVGQGNLDWAGPQQTLVLDAGLYELSWYWRTDDLTTDEGIRLRVFDAQQPARLDRQSDSVTGSTGWTLNRLRFTVDRSASGIIVQFRRNPSLKLNNEIKGQAWVDEVQVKRIQ